MARYTDVLAGCVVGGALVAAGMVLASRGHGAEELHVTMLKDNTAAMVWAVDRETGKARFVSLSTMSPEAIRMVTREQARQAGELLASGFAQAAIEDVFAGLGEGAARVPPKPKPR